MLYRLYVCSRSFCNGGAELRRTSQVCPCGCVAAAALWGTRRERGVQLQKFLSLSAESPKERSRSVFKAVGWRFTTFSGGSGIGYFLVPNLAVANENQRASVEDRLLPKGKMTVFCAKAEAVGRDSFCVETPLVVGPREGGRSGHQAFAGLLAQGCPACAVDCVDCPVHAIKTEAERAYAGMPGRPPEESR